MRLPYTAEPIKYIILVRVGSPTTCIRKVGFSIRLGRIRHARGDNPVIVYFNEFVTVSQGAVQQSLDTGNTVEYGSL